ncbi:hypothetical protein EV356DRAFT_506794 [Viridothelium virens]|uniref:Uncharacterized protein n=1 Tax=Viridothelium virens TaxID=1048519 RepID=A0A6A6H1J6_VIRVR|nr:hypothetical protein EV356DRAFT_506794 [Viridothelium virens]
MRDELRGLFLAGTGLAQAFGVVPLSDSISARALNSSNGILSSLPIKAIVPTRSGQIGVNPLTAYIGPISQFIQDPVGQETILVAPNPSATSWIGSNTMNLTDFTSTSGTLTTTESVPASVTTVASATGALSEGDVSLVLAPFLRDQLEVAAKAAVSACEAVNKAKRSDLSSEDGGFESCLISEALATAQPGGIMDAAAGYIESLNLDVSSSFKSPLDAAIAVAKSQARRKTFYVAFTFFSIYATKKAVMWQLRFPKAPKIPTKGWAAPSSTSSPTTCPPGAPTGSNMPVCEDEDCNGLDQKCSSGPWKNCDCAGLIHYGEGDGYEGILDWFDQQQAILTSIDDLPVPKPTPSCFANSDGPDFSGKAKATPATWCVCGASKKIYPTLSSTTRSPCGYTSLPSTTISITRDPLPSAAPTSCRLTTVSYPADLSAALTGTYTGCTCNDNRHWGITTYSSGSLTSVGCVTPTSSSSSASSLPPVTTGGAGTVQCLAKHQKDDQNWYMNAGLGYSAVSNFCTGIAPYETIGPGGQSSDGYWTNPSTTYPPPNPIIAAVTYEGGDCPPIDFHDHSNVDLCLTNLKIPLDNCDHNTGSWFNTQGGNLTQGCYVWSIFMCNDQHRIGQCPNFG